MRNNCPSAIRHCLIRVRNDRHDRHATGERESQRENYSYLFHDRVPFSPASPTLPKPARNSVIAITFRRFFRGCSERLGLDFFKKEGRRSAASRLEVAQPCHDGAQSQQSGLPAEAL
jgi:hypothetical protein